MALELQRKTFHILLAILFALLAPLVSHQVLAVMGMTLFVFFLFLRLVGLSHRVGTVPRITFGELFFAAAVFGAAILSYPDVFFFQLSMMILAVADPLAALVGTRFGKRTYSILDEKRTVEGSVACFAGALAVLLLFQVTFLIALFVSLVLTVIEALSLRGSDNLLLPLTTIVLLQFLL